MGDSFTFSAYLMLYAYTQILTLLALSQPNIHGSNVELQHILCFIPKFLHHFYSAGLEI
jgi:hypothetical protein